MGWRRPTARGQSTAADVDPLDRRPCACRPDEAGGLKVDSDSSMEVAGAGRVGGAGVAGGRLLAEEVRDGPAPLRLEDPKPVSQSAGGLDGGLLAFPQAPVLRPEA